MEQISKSKRRLGQRTSDLPSYIMVQDTVSTEFQHPGIWARKAIHNVARIGKFSSDRTISEYARDIWHIQRVYR